MPVLLLAYGDPKAKDLLRKAIEARYGSRPPVLESLRINFKGRVRAKIGPITAWVPIDVTAYFRFPRAMRWDFTIKPLGLPIQRGVEAFDGLTYWTARGGKTPVAVEDPEQVGSMRRRLWAIASILLTPLSSEYVKLTLNEDTCFTAINTQLDDAAEVHLRSNNTLNHVKVAGLDPEGKKRAFTLRLSENQVELSDLILPKQIASFWDDAPYFEIEPVKAETNPQIADAIFTIDD